MLHSVLAACLQSGHVLQEAVAAVYHNHADAWKCTAHGFNEPGEFVQWTFAMVELQGAWHLIVTNEMQCDYDEYVESLAEVAQS
jgi:hypothetical protein